MAIDLILEEIGFFFLNEGILNFLNWWTYSFLFINYKFINYI